MPERVEGGMEIAPFSVSECLDETVGRLSSSVGLDESFVENAAVEA
jgi:hypothetical protein